MPSAVPSQGLSSTWVCIANPCVKRRNRPTALVWGWKVLDGGHGSNGNAMECSPLVIGFLAKKTFHFCVKRCVLILTNT